ncbi:MAG: DUF3794 domain-containing protein [Firmicutes bacterium]|nr:DUF3794 domain-containing protein [Bacillota bacterium]
MGEILYVEGTCSVIPMEKKVASKTDEDVSLSGSISLQILYLEEGKEKNPVPMNAKLTYKYTWSLGITEQVDIYFSCRIKSLEYLIVNERKLRVKISLEFTAQVFCLQEMYFFTGLKDDSLELKKKEIPLSYLSLVKREQVTIDESFECKDSGITPAQICKNSFTIVENYRQVTTEKIVINGFLFVHLIYMGNGDELGEVSLCNCEERLEFTQFIPLEKSQRGKKWSGVRTVFSSNDLQVVIKEDSEGQGCPVFHVEGNIYTRVELYEEQMAPLIVDAYHKEKGFSCQYEDCSMTHMGQSAVSEVTFRELVHLPEGSSAESGVCCTTTLKEENYRVEKGKVQIEGAVQSNCVWKDRLGYFHGIAIQSNFQTSVDLDGLEREMEVRCRCQIKSSWITVINEKQLEVHYTILFSCESYEDRAFTLMTEPFYLDDIVEKTYPLIIVNVQRGESTWDLAKRYRVSEDQLRRINHLEQDPKAGDKLILMK